MDWISESDEHPTVTYAKTYTGNKLMLPPKPENWTRFVCFSDTHGKHTRISHDHIIEADVLLHGGDFTSTGRISDVQSFNKWLLEYPAKHKVVIAGNHDITFDKEFYLKNYKRFMHRNPEYSDEAKNNLIQNNACHYIEDELIEIEGYKIYGSPHQPTFCNWAFNLERGPEINQKWKMIPDEVDILMTHGPIFGHGDTTCFGSKVGCEDLRRHVMNRILNPIHVFGHIHEDYGTTMEDGVVFINASTCNKFHKPLNAPVVLDLPPVDILRRQYREEREKHA